MTHRAQKHCLGVVRVLGHQACVARLCQRSGGGDAKPHTIESLRTVACNRVGEMPVQNGELARTRKPERESADRVATDLEREKYPGAAGGGLAHALKRWIADEHLLERFKIDRAAMLY